MKNKYLMSYIETALWSSTGDDDEPLDSKYNFSDLSAEAIVRAQRDIEAFLQLIANIPFESNLSQVMHDFWLTRNHHGAGFWDGDYDKEIGEQLTKISHGFGEINLYVGDDGKLYFDRN